MHQGRDQVHNCRSRHTGRKARHFSMKLIHTHSNMSGWLTYVVLYLVVSFVVAGCGLGIWIVGWHLSQPKDK